MYYLKLQALSSLLVSNCLSDMSLYFSYYLNGTVTQVQHLFQGWKAYGTFKPEVPHSDGRLHSSTSEANILQG